MLDITAMFKISYGIYLITSHDGEKLGGCLVNTVFQLTAEPISVGVSVAKANQTHEMIEKSGTIGVTVVSEETPSKLLGKFGYKSGRDVDKFADTLYHLDCHGDALIDEGAVSHFSCKVKNSIDLDTHTIYICDVIDATKVNDEIPMTYNYYREVKKGQSSKFAPTYVNPMEIARLKKNES